MTGAEVQPEGLPSREVLDNLEKHLLGRGSPNLLDLHTLGQQPLPPSQPYPQIYLIVFKALPSS